MNKQKIFLLINSLERGGAETVVRKLYHILQDKFDIKIITLKDLNTFDDVEYTPLSKIKSNLFPLLFPVYIYKLRRLIKKEKPYKVISFLEWANYLNILSNKESIISLRNHMNSFKGFKGFIYRVLIKNLYPKAKKIIVNSYQNKHDLYKVIKHNDIQVLYNPILKPVSEYDSNINYKFITVCRLVKEKHVIDLVNSFKDVMQPNDKFVIVGTGPEEIMIRNRIIQLGLEDNIIMVGFQYDVYKYLNQAEYFIYASEVEGFPNVLIEAMDCGLPIITTDFKSGAREIIEPGLDFDKDIHYPFYGANGVLVDRFSLKGIDFSKVKQSKLGINRFWKDDVIKQFEEIVK
jgi:N-acetylgalactosamine-N,N'-diacetylbacillosaminyl-diphospho-undecaprenol 4-alpha-N-acetylgalactosaminyltransferase